MIVRVRIEAANRTEEDVRSDLAAGLEMVRSTLRGDWQEGEPQIQTSREGFWGFQTITEEGN